MSFQLLGKSALSTFYRLLLLRSWVEGGTGANTYCTPMSGDCDGGIRAAWTGPQYKKISSEQNWQGSAFRTLAVCSSPDLKRSY